MYFICIEDTVTEKPQTKKKGARAISEVRNEEEEDYTAPDPTEHRPPVALAAFSAWFSVSGDLRE